MTTGQEKDPSEETSSTTPEAPANPFARVQIAEDCSYCQKYGGGMMPPHEASKSCKSGRRNHCTCDTCF